MKLPMQLLDEASDAAADIGSPVVVCQAKDRRNHVVPYKQAQRSVTALVVHPVSTCME
jgi:hypothetical protein